MFETIVRLRCDRSMRRSKERGRNIYGIRWKCPGDCRRCFCCIEQDQDGNERHRPYSRHKGGKNDKTDSL